MRFLSKVLLFSCLSASSFSQDDQRAGSSNEESQNVRITVQFNRQEYRNLFMSLYRQNIMRYETVAFNNDDLVNNFSIEEVAAVNHVMRRMPRLFEQASHDSIAYQNFSLFDNFLHDWEKNNRVKIADILRNDDD